jgi:Zn-dependent peptidase ImmA (M78 family)/DNA-binding XRE family transcriptional regulator
VIHGERVKLARELRGLTQKQLATAVHVSQSTVAYLESGRHSPSAELIASIAHKTGFPPDFFQIPPPDNFSLGSLLLFRSKASATARREAQAHRYAQLAYELATKLSEQFSRLPLSLPQLPNEHPERAAELARSSFGLSPDTPIQDLTHSIERAGVVVLALPIVIRDIDAFSLWAGGDVDQPVLAVLSGSPGDRRRLSLAHEIGHLVMHRSLQGTTSELEQEAYRFAGALLLPETAMRQEIVPPLTLTALASLKRRWKVSMQALAMRAHELSIITERQKRYLFQKMSARGWRVAEPSSLMVPEEMPRAIRQMAEMAYGNPIAYGQLARDIDLPEDLLMDIIGEYAGKAPADSNVLQFPSGR